MNPHPIEAESYEILRARVDLSGLPPGERAVVERVVHASADLEYAETMVFAGGAVDAAVAAVRSGAAIVCDVEMVRSGITGGSTCGPVVCALRDPEVSVADGETRSAAAMRSAASRTPHGAVFVVGCAPTALFELVRLAGAGVVDPACVIGMPVGFVGAAESKDALRRSGLRAISNIGEKGGSAVAAAACNAVIRLAEEGTSE